MEPITFVVFGSTGDLAQRKIMPALCGLFLKGAFPQGSNIIAYSRRMWSDEDYRNFIRPSLSKFGDSEIGEFLKYVSYVEGTFDDPASYQKLKEKILTDKVFYHLAVRPDSYVQIGDGLGNSGLKGSLLIEKPFGFDLHSAKALEERLEKNFSKDSIFRIDHYLGKAGIDEVWKKRISDKEFEGKLNNQHVESIKFRLLEKIDIEGRGEFYDEVGAIRDVGQNHILEMAAVFLSDIHNENAQRRREEALLKLIPVTSHFEKTIERGQYEGYRDEKDVKEDSETETHFKITTESDDEKWKNVPLIFEGGKRMTEKRNDIVIRFKDGKDFIFNLEEQKGEAYEVVLEAAMKGNVSRFVSYEEVIASWEFIMSVLDHLKEVPLRIY